jgi:hypothetical protein
MSAVVSKEVAVCLDGGLGNQLFQYAAGRALALRLGASLVLDTSALEQPPPGVTPRQFELHCFGVAARIATDDDKAKFRRLRRWRGLRIGVGNWRLVRERGMDYQQGFDGWGSNSYLVGYWQSHRYLAETRAELVNELQPLSPLSLASQAIQRHLSSCESVALHVRRSDYVSLPTAAQFHGALSLSYYVRAISKLRSVLQEPHFFVFSDDMVWCREQLGLSSSEATYVDHNQGPNAWQDLILMSHCRHQVIANSSFSWWGAWLGDQHAHRSVQSSASNRQVIAPERWFAGTDNSSSQDRLPAQWSTTPC